MAFKWGDPGGSATGGTQLLDSPTSGITAVTSPNNGQAYAYQASTLSPAANQTTKKLAVLQAAGNRISAFIRVPALPTGSDTAVTLLGATPTGSTTTLLTVRLDTAGKLRLYTNNVTTLLKQGTTVLSTGQWYRISLSYAITTTTNWSAKVYIGDSATPEFTATNADGTLSSAAPADLSLMGVGTALGANFLLYVSDIYVDDTTDQSNPGNVHVSRRAVTTVSSGSWDTTTGTGDLTERPPNTANRIGQLATTQATVDYNVEAASAGDADLTGVTIRGRAAFAWFTLSSLTGTPTGTLRIDGAGVGSAMDPASANTYQLAWAADTTASYPSTVGVTSSGLAADTLVAELGAIVAYVPSSSNNYTRDEAGNQPSSTGTLARIYQALRSLVGSQPAATGTLARVYQALRSLAGNQPAPTGTLARLLSTARSLTGNQPAATGALTASKLSLRNLAGNQPSPSGALTNQKIVARSVAGDQPAATGSIARQLSALRSLAGNQPAATGSLSRTIAVTRSLAGDQPTASGALTRIKQAVRSLSGDQPNATGALGRILQALRSLAGNQPSSTGTLTAQTLVGLRRAIVSWIEFEAPFAIRTLTGNQPSASGTLARIRSRLYSLAGNQPNATGTLTRLIVRLRSLAGNQPAATGTLARIKQAIRALAGNQPTATGTLARHATLARTLTGDQPAASGDLSRHADLHRSLDGDQPAAAGELARLLATTRLLAGDEPAPTGELVAFIGVQNAIGSVGLGSTTLGGIGVGSSPLPESVAVGSSPANDVGVGVQRI